MLISHGRVATGTKVEIVTINVEGISGLAMKFRKIMIK